MHSQPMSILSPDFSFGKALHTSGQSSLLPTESGASSRQLQTPQIDIELSGSKDEEELLTESITEEMRDYKDAGEAKLLAFLDFK